MGGREGGRAMKLRTLVGPQAALRVSVADYGMGDEEVVTMLERLYRHLGRPALHDRRHDLRSLHLIWSFAPLGEVSLIVDDAKPAAQRYVLAQAARLGAVLADPVPLATLGPSAQAAGAVASDPAKPGKP